MDTSSTNMFMLTFYIDYIYHHHGSHNKAKLGFLKCNANQRKSAIVLKCE